MRIASIWLWFVYKWEEISLGMEKDFDLEPHTWI
jgi:hypothetical protein